MSIRADAAPHLGASLAPNVGERHIVGEAFKMLAPVVRRDTVPTVRRIQNLIQANTDHLAGRLVSNARPVKLTAESTNICNLKCPACFTGVGEHGRQKGHMPLDLFRRIMDEIGPYLWEAEFFNWGEPLLGKNTFEMIRLARRQGISTTLSSNLSFRFDDEKVEELVSSGLTVLSVSIDGARQETYEQYRVGGNLSLVLDNVRRITEAKQRLGVRSPTLFWGFKLFPHNVDDVEVARQMATDLGMQFETEKGWLLGGDWDTEQRFGWTFWPPSLPERCRFLWHSAVIHPDGGVAPCAGTFHATDDLGRIEVTPGDGGAKSFMEVWNGPRMQKSRGFFESRNVGEEDRKIVCHGCERSRSWEDWRNFLMTDGRPGGFQPSVKLSVANWFDYLWKRTPTRVPEQPTLVALRRKESAAKKGRPADSPRKEGEPFISIIVPVFRGEHLAECIRSVLRQTSSRWRLHLGWDGGDERSRRLLERIERRRDPRIDVSYHENMGIAPTLRLLTERANGDWLLLLDDDDRLGSHAVERFLVEARLRPWAGALRARRRHIDTRGALRPENDALPFGQRKFEHGMVQDIWNFAHPFCIRRTAYDQTPGWVGYDDFCGAGEDCAMGMDVEQVAPIELIDEFLYYYRIHDGRASNRDNARLVHDVWRRLIDRAITRTGLSVRRTNESQPFHFERIPREPLLASDIDFILGVPEGASAFVTAWRSALTAWGAPESSLFVQEGSVPGAWRAGVRATERRAVALIDARAVPPDGATLTKLLAALNAPCADVVAPKVLDRNGSELVARASFDAAGYPIAVGSQGNPAKSSWLGPAFLLVHREVLRAIGLPEARLPPALSALDICLRARMRDLVCVEVDATVTLSAGLELRDEWSEYRRRWYARPELTQSRSIVGPGGEALMTLLP